MHQIGVKNIYRYTILLVKQITLYYKNKLIKSRDRNHPGVYIYKLTQPAVLCTRETIRPGLVKTIPVLIYDLASYRTGRI
jgi:hypothetical protein